MCILKLYLPRVPISSKHSNFVMHVLVWLLSGLVRQPFCRRSLSNFVKNKYMSKKFSTFTPKFFWRIQSAKFTLVSFKRNYGIYWPWAPLWRVLIISTGAGSMGAAMGLLPTNSESHENIAPIDLRPTNRYLAIFLENYYVGSMHIYA